MNVSTERLIIRPFVPEDLSDLHEILGDAETMRYSEAPFDLAKTEVFLRDFCISRGRALAASEKISGKVIGYILFSSLDDGVFEAGWFINRAFWRLGYAYEAMCAVFRQAFSDGALKIIAETADPVKSVGLMKKLGMRPCGEEDGLLVYELSRDDCINIGI